MDILGKGKKYCNNRGLFVVKQRTLAIDANLLSMCVTLTNAIFNVETNLHYWKLIEATTIKLWDILYRYDSASSCIML